MNQADNTSQSDQALSDTAEMRLRKQKDKLQMYLREFHRSRSEEWANGISHLIGVIFGIVALTLSCVFAAMYGTAKHVASVAIFGSTLIILYSSSMLYHVFSNFKVKRIFQLFDHCSIYLLIAGTYTPFALVSLDGKTGWWIFGIEWGLAILGILISVLCPPKLADKLSLPIYLIMGWLIIIAFPQVRANMSTAGLATLFAGGLSYTFGVIFFLLDKIPYMHTIWHFFVLGGSVCHWVCITFFVIPRN
jgi:hemolysin III